MQGLELLATVLLARNRLPPTTVAAGVAPVELAAELVSLPSGLLAMVCEAIVRLKVRLGAACMGHKARRGPHGCTAHVTVGQGQRSHLGCMRSAGSIARRTGLDALQASDVVRAGRDSQRTGPLRRSSQLSTLWAGASA